MPGCPGTRIIALLHPFIPERPLSCREEARRGRFLNDAFAIANDFKTDKGVGGHLERKRQANTMLIVCSPA